MNAVRATTPPASAGAAVHSHLDGLCAADEAFRRELLGLFVDEGAKDVALIAEAVRRGDTDAVLGLVHLFRGACSTMGAAALALECRAIEAALRSGAGIEQVAADVARLEDSWERLRGELQQPLHTDSVA